MLLEPQKYYPKLCTVEGFILLFLCIRNDQKIQFPGSGFSETNFYWHEVPGIGAICPQQHSATFFGPSCNDDDTADLNIVLEKITGIDFAGTQDDWTDVRAFLK